MGGEVEEEKGGVRADLQAHLNSLTACASDRAQVGAA